MMAFKYAFLAALIWGIVPVFEKLGLSRVEPVVGLFFRSIGVILGLAILAIFVIKQDQIKSVDARSILFLVLSGFLASFVAQIFFYHGLKIGEISKIVPIAGSYPLIVFVLGIMFLGESITISKAFGVILITSGIWFLR